MDILGYTLRVRRNLNSRIKSVEATNSLAKDAKSFIDYCYNHFDKTDKEIDKCSVGILLKFDSQKNPDKYKNYNMDSMFDIHLVAGRFTRDENHSAIKNLEDEIISQLNSSK